MYKMLTKYNTIQHNTNTTATTAVVIYGFCVFHFLHVAANMNKSFVGLVAFFSYY